MTRSKPESAVLRHSEFRTTAFQKGKPAHKLLGKKGGKARLRKAAKARLDRRRVGVEPASEGV